MLTFYQALLQRYHFCVRMITLLRLQPLQFECLFTFIIHNWFSFLCNLIKVLQSVLKNLINKIVIKLIQSTKRL